MLYSSPIMTCFVQYSTFTVYHILCLDSSVLLLFIRIVAFSLSLVLSWPWNLLFGRIYESLETWKVLLNFIYRSKPSCTFIQLLWQWNTPFLMSGSSIDISLQTLLWSRSNRNPDNVKVMYSL
jgi:hypothetical protein